MTKDCIYRNDFFPLKYAIPQGWRVSDRQGPTGMRLGSAEPVTLLVIENGSNSTAKLIAEDLSANPNIRTAEDAASRIKEFLQTTSTPHKLIGRQREIQVAGARLLRLDYQQTFNGHTNYFCTAVAVVNKCALRFSAISPQRDIMEKVCDTVATMTLK
jgi:hypothetical protein